MNKLLNEINKIKETVKLMGEVSDDIYNKIKTIHSTDRIIMSDNPDIKFIPSTNQRVSAKPKGLWYGIGDSWISWVRSEMPDWESEYVFKIDIDENNIIKITNYNELVDFENEYGVDGDSYFSSNKYRNINWDKVAKNYGGIEIAPYIYKARLTHMWYYGWDVASGCIWSDNVITNITKLNK